MNNNIWTDIISFLGGNERCAVKSLSTNFYNLEKTVIDENIYKYYKNTKKKSCATINKFIKKEIGQFENIYALIINDIDGRCIKSLGNFKNLTTLTIKNMNYEKINEILTFLNSTTNNIDNLTLSYDRTVNISYSSVIDNLPLKLSSLSLINMYVREVNLKRMPNLKCLRLQNVTVMKTYNFFLPNNIEKLILNISSSARINNLPEKIKKLLFLPNFNFINFLPNNLKILYLSSNYIPIDNNIIYLPDKTTHLITQCGYNKTTNIISNSLTHLYLGNKYNTEIEFLPETLEVLYLGFEYNKSLKFIESLKNLKTLYINQNLITNEFIKESFFKIIYINSPNTYNDIIKGYM